MKCFINVYRYVAVWALLIGSLSGQVAVPTYRAARTADEVRVDGKLDEFSWAVAPRVGRFANIRDLGRTDTAPTEAALLWDDRYLYVAFACHDPEPWSTMRNHDDHLWEQEVVEVFLDPDADGTVYPELEVSPHNVVVDLLIPRPRAGFAQAIDWDIVGLKTGVVKNASGWTVEIAIPWQALAKAGADGAPRPGERWRVGLYRIERPGGPEKEKRIRELRGRLESAPRENRTALRRELDALQKDLQYLAWSPTKLERGFHDPERFGVVEFVLRP